jgi:formylglycine-generating enzyme required for sulfatase activity
VVGSVRDGDSAGGLHDMAGNVAEWLIDRYGAMYYASEIERNDPAGPTDGTLRVARGGDWLDDATLLPTWARAAAAPTNAGAALGFRCAAPE